MDSFSVARSAVSAILTSTERQIDEVEIFKKVLRVGASCFDVFEKASA